MTISELYEIDCGLKKASPLERLLHQARLKYAKLLRDRGVPAGSCFGADYEELNLREDWEAFRAELKKQQPGLSPCEMRFFYAMCGGIDRVLNRSANPEADADIAMHVRAAPRHVVTVVENGTVTYLEHGRVLGVKTCP